MKSNCSKRSDLIKEARERFTRGDYATLRKLREIRCDGKIVYLANRLLTPEELFEYYDYVERVQSSATFVADVIGKLIDHKIYESLCKEGREKYVLEVAELYCYLLGVYKIKHGASS